MKYLEKLKRQGRMDLYIYTKYIFEGNVPDFLEKYLTLPMFQTLEGKGQFCGVNNTNLYNPKCQYNRLDHSVNCAGIIWRLTKNKRRTICALCHDLSTVSFAHTIDFLLKDSINQNSSESLINIKEILAKSKEFQKYLQEDNLRLEDVWLPNNDSLVDIERPSLCVDRLEGIIHTNYIWLNICNFTQVKEILDDLTICLNENNKEEIGFRTLEISQKFFEMILNYAYALQSKEDKYPMQFIADLLEIAIKDNLLKMSDLYNLQEEKIVALLKSNYKIWQDFEKLNKVLSSNIKPNGYFVEVEAKKRYANPLILIGDTSKRITDVDVECNDKLQKFLKFSEQKYLFSDKIKVLVREDLC